MTYQITSRTFGEQPTAVIEGRLPAAQLSTWLPQAYQEVYTYLEREGVPPAGAPFARYTFHEDLVDVQAGFPVGAPVAGVGRIVPATLPACQAAVTTHYGPYQELDAAYHALAVWLKEHDQEVGGPHWEIYHTNPEEEPDPARWRTEVVMPLAE